LIVTVNFDEIDLYSLLNFEEQVLAFLSLAIFFYAFYIVVVYFQVKLLVL